MQEPLSPAIMAVLPQWVAQQRWYAGKGRVPVLRHIGGLRLEDPAEEVDINVHLLLDESGRTPTTYQVPLTCRTERLAGADHALVATEEAGTEGGDGTVTVQLAPSNCVQCGAITAKGGRLTPPEGGSGPEYTLT